MLRNTQFTHTDEVQVFKKPIIFIPQQIAQLWHSFSVTIFFRYVIQFKKDKLTLLR